MQLEDRFYTSTEVADILGVSLRSVYRYLEDGKLDAEVKTATGRHRFTKQNILDFLYPGGEEAKPTFTPEPAGETEVPSAAVAAPVPTTTEQLEPVPPVSEPQQQPEEIDWLSKFREAATKFKEEQEKAPEPEIEEAAVVTEEPVPDTIQNIEQVSPSKTIEYYRSMLGGLKDIAQSIDRNAREVQLDYAFTMNAGLSLHKPIKPFATLHVYFRSDHRDYYEKALRLTPSDQGNAQLCVIYSNNDNIYDSKEEVHGLRVVSRPQLNRDIDEMGDSALIQELEAVFS